MDANANLSDLYIDLIRF